MAKARSAASLRRAARRIGGISARQRRKVIREPRHYNKVKMSYAPKRRGWLF